MLRKKHLVNNNFVKAKHGKILQQEKLNEDVQEVLSMKEKENIETDCKDLKDQILISRLILSVCRVVHFSRET